MSKKISTIELQKENMDFSAGHFTIFSATEREPLHGHNYNVCVALTTEVDDNGLSFDYRFYKDKVIQFCQQLNQTFLLPSQSKHLKITEQDCSYLVIFNQEKLSFLKKDATLVPLTNITVEELSSWFVEKIIEDKALLDEHKIQSIVVKEFSGPGQAVSAQGKKS